MAETKLENEVKNDILRKWGSIPEIVLFRINTGVAHYNDPERYVRFSVKGYPDFQGIIKGGRTLYIETKREKGGRQSKEQQIFQRTVESMGAVYILARSVEDVDRVLNPILGKE
jgi:hypothetical protein